MRALVCGVVVLATVAWAEKAPELKAAPARPAAEAKAAEHHAAEQPGVDAKAALKRLTAGNERFVTGKPKHGDESPEVRKALADGQKPFAVVLSCSDSRVPPELVFDQGLGQLFVVRVAGNDVDAYDLASIEYAVEHLGARLVMVMGHESCGAIKATLTTPEGKSAGSPSLDALVGSLRSHLADAALTDADRADKKLGVAVKANVNAVASLLPEKSPVIKERLEGGALAIQPAMYHLDTGLVELWAAPAKRGPAGAQRSQKPGVRPAEKPASSH